MNKAQSRTAVSIADRATLSLVLAFYTAALVTQILVICKIIPYQWVNGGMSVSYDVQAVQSVVSIAITLLLFVFVMRMVSLKGCLKVWQRRSLYVITAWWTLGLLLQLIGTPFERYVMSPVLLVGVVGHLIITRQIHIQAK
jgi:hypothetical protein